VYSDGAFPQGATPFQGKSFNVSKYLRDKLGPAFIGAQMVDVE